MINHIHNYLKDKLQNHLPMFMFLYATVTILIILSIILLYLDHEEMISFIDFIHHNNLEIH